MEDIKVKCKEMLISALTIESYAAAIKRMEEELTSVINSLNTQIIADAKIGMILSTIRESIDAYGNDFSLLSDCLKDAVTTYQISEKNIIEHYKGMESNNSAEGSTTTNNQNTDNSLEETDSFMEFFSNRLGDGSTSMDALKAFLTGQAAIASGCKIVKNGNYYIIKGLYANRNNIDDLKNILGTRYKIGSNAFNASNLGRFVPEGTTFTEGAKKFLTNMKDGSIMSNSFKEFGKNAYSLKGEKLPGIVGKGLSYAAIALETGSDLYDNINNNASGSKIAADVVTDVGKGLGAMAVGTACAQVGAAIGTAIPIPGVGTAVGAGVGFVAGVAGCVVYDYVIDGIKIGDKTIAGWTSYAIENTIDTVGDAVSDVGEALGDGFETAKDAVGDFFSGVGNAVFSW